MRKLILLSILFFGGVFYSNAQNILPFKTWDLPKKVDFVPEKSAQYFLDKIDNFQGEEKIRKMTGMTVWKPELEIMEKSCILKLIRQLIIRC